METRLTGPPTLDIHQLIPLTVFARDVGLAMPLYTTPDLWEQVVRHAPFDVCAKLANVVGNALGNRKADKPDLYFTYRSEVGEEGKAKIKKVRMRVSLYQTREGQVWVLLNLAQVQLRLVAGRSSA